MVSRMGGDEFVIMMPETTIHQAMKLAERVLKLFRTGGSMMQVSAQGKNLPASSLLSCSIGITDSVFSDEDSQVADPVETLLNRADKAMYVSKAEGKGRVTKS